MTQENSPFRPNDEKAFITLMQEQLKKGSAKVRGITTLEYVDMARCKIRSNSSSHSGTARPPIPVTNRPPIPL